MTFGSQSPSGGARLGATHTSHIMAGKLLYHVVDTETHRHTADGNIAIALAASGANIVCHITNGTDQDCTVTIAGLDYEVASLGGPVVTGMISTGSGTVNTTAAFESAPSAGKGCVVSIEQVDEAD